MNAKTDDKKTINDAPEWTAIRQNWAKEQTQRVQAHALRVFDVDDELPLSRHILLGTIVLFFFAMFVLASWITLDEVTRGDGKVIPPGDVQAVQREESGIVEEILVQEGDKVQAGQVLMRLSDIAASSDLGANKARFLGLLASITRLQTESRGELSVDFPKEVVEGCPSCVTEELNTFRANQQQLQGQINVLQEQFNQREQELRELNTRITDTRGVISIQRQEMAMIEPLVERGSAPKLELLQLERGLKEKNSELNGYLSSLPRVKSSIGEVKARIDEAKTSAQAQAQTELSAKLIEMNEAQERLSALKERKNRKEITSPVSGIIQEITVNTIGGVVRPGEDIIKVVPEGENLIVEARIRPGDRAFIHPGQKARIKITAYDFSIYGALDGELSYISQDTFEDEQGNSFYRVRLRTDKNHLVHKGEIKPITTGMVTSVDILTGKKTIMQYLLKPFIKTLDNAMNER
ncbi:MAG: HlyD family type I secretion periplasmic adaptor subunit [Alphaproteobacteria bacterium]|nr:HlyD family type I secretion periplasmic adaptor subunit [Alphaproteobacteria bacterium]